jgi:3-mercaptopyruvate sulfurtransferase SseA/sterol desaturase/sphingolipid hydroxylase (fatty acid hydroxylase superfamily)
VTSVYIYPIALVLISAFVALLEFLIPKRKEQRQLRDRLLSDFVHLAFNGHFLGVILFGIATTWVLPHLDAWLASVGWTEVLYRNAAASWPMWAQIIVAILVIDFIQWAIHNLLHRVSFLWEFHKTHHSIIDGEMDWIVSFRFQWVEVLVYRSLLYLPLAFFGFSETAVLVHAIFGTLIGHLNHANLDLDWGPLRYVLNSPNMHIWHHDYDGDTETTVNFGIILSTWDWIFGTAKMPDRPPARLGFAGVETFPTNFFSQSIWPLQKAVPALSDHQLAASLVGVALIATAWFVHSPPGGGASTPTPMFGEVAAASQPVSESAPGADAYGRDEAARAEALGRFGEDARAAGYAHPEWMVSVPELARALGHPRLVLLDVRPADRFAIGHVPTARQLYRPDYSQDDPVPGLSSDLATLQAMLARRGVKKDSVVVAYTDGGPEHYRLWWTLREVAGYDVRVLDGGLQRWKALGHGLAEGGGLEPAAGDLELAEPQAPHRPEWAPVAAFRDAHPGAVLLDTRSAEEFSGKKHHKKAARAGHIPDARHLEWWAIVRDTESDHRLLPPAELTALFARVGVTPETPVVTYCQSGTRSAGTYFALAQLGHDTLRNYDGSWAEYSRLTELPVSSEAD